MTEGYLVSTISPAVMPFSFEGLPVRILYRDSDPWFVLADICRVLAIGNTSDAARRLDDDEKHTLDNVEGIADARAQALTVINESGLYSLILTSRKDAAKRFKRWVTAEVLPSIRKTGSYGAAAPALNLDDPVVLRGLLADYATKRLEAEQRAEAASGTVAAFERIAAADGAMCITDAAKVLQVRPKDLFGYL
ncbi:BRO family protein [Tistrella bauzanensis]|uniref:BRO family protein n=1 Tax=Tistrella TaxID=171436 RepID=UPI0035577EF5